MTEIEYAAWALVLAIVTIVVQHVLLRRAERDSDTAEQALIGIGLGELTITIVGHDVLIKPTNKTGE